MHKMRVTYGEPRLDVSPLFVSSGGIKPDYIVLPSTRYERADCLGVPLLANADVFVEDDLGSKQVFKEGETIVLEKIDTGYKIADTGMLIPGEVPTQIILNRIANQATSVLEIGGRDDGAIAILAKRLQCDVLSIKTDANMAHATRLKLEESGWSVAVEGAIISPVPLVKNVDMLKEAEIGFDDIDTWKPVDTLHMEDLIAKYPGMFEKGFDTVLMTCNHDKFRPLIVDYPQVLNGVQHVVVKTDFMMPLDHIYIDKDLETKGFSCILTIGSSAPDAKLPYSPIMYKMYKKM